MDPFTMGAMMFTQVLGGVAQSEIYAGQAAIAGAQGRYLASQLEMNARFAEMDAEYAIKMGNKAAADHQKKVSQVKGSQRAALAASGVSVDVGTASELQEETAYYGALDTATIKNNAWRQAFGFEQEALSSRFQASMAQISGASAQQMGMFQARQSLITGGLQALNTGLQYSGKATK